MELKVALPVYDGPLDLLLNLIEKNKVNIFDIPIVMITDQYLDYVRQMDREDLSVMSEFMVMAAELIAIKCKMLLPAEVDEEGEEIDPRADLVARLLEYKTYKYMSYELRERMKNAGKNLYKPDTTPPEVKSWRPKADPAELIGDLTLKKLHAVFNSVIRRQADRVDPIRSSFGTIKKEEVRLSDRVIFVADFAKEHGSFSFAELLLSDNDRIVTIVTFLAVLELMKYGIVEASQEEIAGDILIRVVEGADIAAVDLESDFEGAS